MLGIDQRLRWEAPIQRPGADPFMIDMERQFAAFLTHHHLRWEYEPRFYYLDNPNREPGRKPCGYCPDFLLTDYGVFIEIYNAMPRENRSERGISELARRKRQRIQLLSRYSGYGTVLVDPSIWTPETGDLDDILWRIERAIIKGMVQRTAHVLNPIRTKWEV